MDQSSGKFRPMAEVEGSGKDIPDTKEEFEEKEKAGEEGQDN